MRTFSGLKAYIFQGNIRGDVLGKAQLDFAGTQEARELEDRWSRIGKLRDREQPITQEFRITKDDVLPLQFLIAAFSGESQIILPPERKIPLRCELSRLFQQKYSQIALGIFKALLLRKSEIKGERFLFARQQHDGKGSFCAIRDV